MIINKVNNQNIKALNTSKFVIQNSGKIRQNKYIQEACNKIAEKLSTPVSNVSYITREADVNKFNFLKTMANRLNQQWESEHILNIYSIVEKPSIQHINIVRKSRDSFESLEKIFSLAKDEKTLEYVENLQYGELKDSQNASAIIIDLLNSKNREKYINKPSNYASYLKLNSNDKDAVSKLDILIYTGKYNRFRYDANLAIKKLMRKKNIKTAMADKTNDLENMYTKDRASFLKSLIKSFTPVRNKPKEETQSAVVNLYATLNKNNLKLRNAILERFKYSYANNKSAQIVQMQTLFNKIDNDKDAKTFVQKAINKDLKISSIEELNEILDTTPLKKANIFFNNAKRIIEHSSGEERKKALVVELENPFFESKGIKVGRPRMVRIYENRHQKDSFITKAAKIIENKINQYRYYRISA